MMIKDPFIWEPDACLRQWEERRSVDGDCMLRNTFWGDMARQTRTPDDPKTTLLSQPPDSLGFQRMEFFGVLQGDSIDEQRAFLGELIQKVVVGKEKVKVVYSAVLGG